MAAPGQDGGGTDIRPDHGTEGPNPHVHHHGAGEAHPASPISFSLLRMSVLQRLIGAAVLATLLWAAVACVMS